MASQRSNQFIEEYAGPVSLYAYLAQRWKVCPIFLRRNLSYKRKHEDAEKKRGDRGLAVSKDKQGSNLSDSPTHQTAHTDPGENKEVQESVNLRRFISSSRKSHLTFRLRFNEGSQESVQKLSELRCLWCDMTCNDLEGLLWHLQASHDRFSYASETATCTPEIYVSVKPSSDIAVGFANFSFFSPRKGGPPLHTSVAHINSFEEEISREVVSSEPHVPRGKRKLGEGKKGQAGEGSSLKPSGKFGKRSISKSSKAGQEKRSEKRSFGERQFYRSQTCLPIDPEDMDYDSDDDVDDEWQLAQAERLMDEFEDVTPREKAFMKLWNRFVHRHAILADFQVPVACETFARNFGQQLIEQGLRDELLFHLFALWDFNLVDKEQIQACIGIVDNMKEAQRGTGEPAGSSSMGASSSSQAVKQVQGGAAAGSLAQQTNGDFKLGRST